MKRVAEAYWVSLDHLWDQRNATYLTLPRQGESMVFPAIRFQEHLIWGLTLRVLTLFSDALGSAAASSGRLAVGPARALCFV